MLYGYPACACDENWLHDCLMSALETMHQLADNDENLPEWPEIFPAAYRDRLRRRTGLRNRISTYWEQYKNLGSVDRDRVLQAARDQNSIANLLDGSSNCEIIDDLPQVIRESAKDLFTFSFKLLSDLSIRSRQYEVVWAHMPDKVCPFCGCECLDAPGAPKEDLDHYLPRYKYSFAAVNLSNLPPMGGRCNSAYKGIKDPIINDLGQCRVAFNPYMAAGLTISLDNSIVDENGVDKLVDDWVIEFQPYSPEVDTWDDVFEIRKRYKRDVLETLFDRWLGDFQNYVRGKRSPMTDDELVEVIGDYYEYVSTYGLRDRCFIKAAFFKFVKERCLAGCRRFLPLFRDLSGLAQPI